MILVYKVNESTVEASWLKTIYDLIDELNCRCDTSLIEEHNRSFTQFYRARIIEISGSNTMVSYLWLRMIRYEYQINKMNTIMVGKGV